MGKSKVMSTLGITAITLAVGALGLFAQSKPENGAGHTAPGNTYLGQVPPGKKAKLFAPEVLNHEPHDSPVLSRDETWFYLNGMGVDLLFYGMVDGRLTSIPNPLGFEIPNPCNGVAMSPSEDRAYIEQWKDSRTQIYYVDRDGDGWTAPTYVDLGYGSNPWQISVALSGNLYFSTDRMMVCAVDGNSHAVPVPVKLEDDSDMLGESPYVAPDESYIIYSIDGDLHISYRRSDGKWTRPVDLGPNINSDQLELCPQITPNGKYLLFNSRRDFPTFAIYWADASFVKELRPDNSK